MQQLYLSRRNLLTLLSKLDRKKAGEHTECTLVKRDTEHPKYPSTDVVIITAVEDEDYYIDRKPGIVHPLDEVKVERCGICGKSFPAGAFCAPCVLE